MNIKKTLRQKLIKLAEKWKEEEIMSREPFNIEKRMKKLDKEGVLLLTLNLTKASGDGPTYYDFNYLTADQIALQGFLIGLDLQSFYNRASRPPDYTKRQMLKDVCGFTDDEIEIFVNLLKRQVPHQGYYIEETLEETLDETDAMIIEEGVPTFKRKKEEKKR